jgi:hypothetical protein
MRIRSQDVGSGDAIMLGVSSTYSSHEDVGRRIEVRFLFGHCSTSDPIRSRQQGKR